MYRLPFYGRAGCNLKMIDYDISPSSPDDGAKAEAITERYRDNKPD